VCVVEGCVEFLNDIVTVKGRDEVVGRSISRILRRVETLLRMTHVVFFWVLGTGYWMQGTGYWQLASGN